jgi:hypothetical protein
MDTEQEEDDQLSIGQVSAPSLRYQARAPAQPSHKAGGKVCLYIYWSGIHINV